MLDFSREIEPIEYVDIEIEVEIYRYVHLYGSCYYGGWAFPLSAICKLEMQESQWCNSSLSLKARELGMQMV